MLVSDLLRRKGDFVAAVSPTTTVSGLLTTLGEHNIGAAVVTSPKGALAGIASERDVVRALAARGAAVLEAAVTEIMSRNVTTASPEDHIDSLMRAMTEQRIRHVPVVADGRLLGIVSIGDVVKIHVDELESERTSLLGYISSAG